MNSMWREGLCTFVNVLLHHITKPPRGYAGERFASASPWELTHLDCHTCAFHRKPCCINTMELNLLEEVELFKRRFFGTLSDDDPQRGVPILGYTMSLALVSLTIRGIEMRNISQEDNRRMRESLTTKVFWTGFNLKGRLDWFLDPTSSSGFQDRVERNRSRSSDTSTRLVRWQVGRPQRSPQTCGLSSSPT